MLRSKAPIHILFAATLMAALGACRKEEIVVRPDNQAPDYAAVPTVVVQNYVNRLFIDLLGREPVDAEMQLEVAGLESGALSMEARVALVDKLMFSTAFVPGDSSYRHAYHQRLYEGFKAHFLEGVSDDVLDGRIADAAQAALADSLGGDTAGASAHSSEYQRLLDLKNSRVEFREGSIQVDEVVERMVLNAVYDDIHMNSFNFVNATFDNLLLRYPTNAEFDAAYAMVETQNQATLFGRSGQSKEEYVDIIVRSNEGHEGLVRLNHLAFLGREPSSSEAYHLSASFIANNDYQHLQRTILTGDEYAGLSN